MDTGVGATPAAESGSSPSGGAAVVDVDALPIADPGRQPSHWEKTFTGAREAAPADCQVASEDKKLNDEEDMSPDLTRDNSSRRKASSISESISEHMIKIGVASHKDEALRMQDEVFFSFVKPLGLVTEKFVIDKDALQQNHSFRHCSNKCCCVIAILMYTLVLAYLVLSFMEFGWSTAQVAVTTEKWEEPSTLLPKIWLKTRDDNVTAVADHCVVKSGNYSGYRYYGDLGIVHPTYGGCETKDVLVDISSKAGMPPQSGGCKHFANEGSGYSCWRLSPNKVVGGYGDNEFEFTKVTLKWPDPAQTESNAASIEAADKTLQELLKMQIRLESEAAISIVQENPKSVPIKEDDTTSYETHYHTVSMEKCTNMEVFFQRIAFRRFTNSDLGLGVMLSGSREALTGDEGGEEEDWTEKHHQYVRSEEVKVRGERLIVFEIFLRATPLQLVKKETPRRMWLELPQVMGGFFTGFVVFTVTAMLAGRQCTFGLIQFCRRKANSKDPPQSKPES